MTDNNNLNPNTSTLSEAYLLSGLSEAEAAERKAGGLVNTPVKPPSKTVPQIIFSNVFTYFNLVYTIFAVILLSVGSYRDLGFMGVILCNTVIGIVQELRSKQVLDRLNVLHAPTALVLRDGQEKRIPAAELVQDDLVIFKAGDQIPADALVCEGSAALNESLLTGEADEIKKAPGDELMSGSFVVSGSLKARLTKVGAASYISQLTLKAKAMKGGEQSEIIRSLNRLVKIMGFAIIPIGIALFLRQQPLFGFTDNMRATIAAVMGMIPEGLFLLASITLALSAVRLAKNQVMIHNMKCIETLARVDVLCVDKTGTITEPEMTVTGLEAVSGSSEELFSLLSDFAAAQDADNITMRALKAYFTAPGGRKPLNISGFSSRFKYSGVQFAEGSYVLGAPEFLLKTSYETWREAIEVHSRQGRRVLAFGQTDAVPDGKELTAPVQLLGLILLENAIRESAPATFRFFAEQGVAIKVISGDNPVTVSRVAARAGIPDAERYIDASALDSEKAAKAAILDYTVFGRVSPEQKKLFVSALKEAGHTVAMTGDGVNDILAMKESDVSVAMAAGSDAAVQASQLVLLESDFAKMPAVVDEGRRVVNNLERSGSFYLVKNVFSFLIALSAICIGFSYPLLPLQITLIGAFTIGIPSFFLAQAPNKDLIRGDFLANVFRAALPGGIADAVTVIPLVLIAGSLDLPQAEIRTAATVTVSAIGMLIHYGIAAPLDRYKAIVFALCGAGLVAVMLIFHSLLELVPLSLPAALLAAGAFVIAVPLYFLFKKLLKK